RFFAIQSAIDLFGPCSPEVEATTNAWYAVGVGGPYVNYVIADFSAIDSVFCNAPASVTFQNWSVNGTTFTWDFGDASPTVSGVNPSHIYSTIGTYDVSLIADGGACGVDTLVLNNLITIDTTIPCIITFPNSGIGTTQTACSGTIYDSGGINGNYGDQQDAQITIAPVGADSVRIDFVSFAVEAGNGPTCNYDYLDIYDGNSISSPLLATYCNNNPPPAYITSSGQALTLVFHSDFNVNLSGFELDWQCYLSSFPPVANFESIDTSSCSGQVDFTDLSTNGPTSWLWHFGDNNTSTLQNPTHTYANSGTYTVKLVTSNQQGIDSLTYTDYIVVDLLDVPVVNGDSICENNTATLSATGIGIPKWYTNALSGSSIFEGNTYNTGNLNTNTTYYVSDFTAGAAFNVGASSNAIGSGGFFNGDQSLVFNCTQACTLKTVDVVAASTGNRTIELRDNSGTILESVTVNIPSTPSQYQTITLNIPIPVGVDLQLGTAVGSNPDLYRNNTGATYPYASANNEISITGTTASAAGYYYFFYNWELELPGCESDRVPVQATVFPDFDLFILNVPTVACAYQSSIQLAGSLPGGTWHANCVNCIDSMTGIFHPDQAGVGVWEVSYTASNNCEKTVSEYIVVESCLGVEEDALSSISLFPNPSKSIVNITANSDIIKSIVITDISGKTIMSVDLNSNQTMVDLNRYESGLYFFNFLNSKGENMSTKKFIRQ
ncbi:MAG: PKD domain-containing protein, partial [Putridiphycobacter sp.]|nr:PKD domain-containing protein [Putridiphycobacter sp.]